MLQIIKPAETITESAYRRMFRADYECHGFKCEDDGTPILKGPREEKLYAECIAKPKKYKDLGRVRREHHRTVPAVGRCSCGRTLALEKRYSAVSVKCDCGRVYRSDGTEISPD